MREICTSGSVGGEGGNILAYPAPNHTLTRAKLEKEFGLLENHFGLFCRRVTEELGADDPDALALVNSSQDEDGNQIFTLKPSVVTAIKSHAFSK